MATEVQGFEARMSRVAEWVEAKVAPPLMRVGNQRHVFAIRAGLIRIIPLIIVGSFPLILANLPVKSWADAMAPYNDSLMTLFQMSFGFLSLFLAISVGAEMGRMYKLEITTVSIITAAGYLITVAPVDLKNGMLPINYLGATGMFSAFVVGIIVAEVMRFMRDHNLTIKMPAGVPENIGASFSALIPLSILLVFFWVLRVLVGFELTKAINAIISPLLIVSDTWYAVLIASFLLTLLWFVGMHGGSLTVQGVLYPLLVANIAANAAAHQVGQPITHVFTEPFVFTWGMPTGVGITLPLIFMWWRSKSARLREVARVGLAPAFFNINEPVNFGAPILLNPVMFLPFVFGSTTLGMMYGYVITRLGLVTAPYVQVPWTTPVLVQPYLSTGGDWRAVIAQLILLIVVAMIWYPFAKVWERRCIAEESAEAAA